MDIATVALHSDAPAKPAFGAACNGCGLCCALTTCPLARIRFLRVRGPCPALDWIEAERRYRCGIGRFMRWLPQRLMLRWIAAGVGCDCRAEMGS
ncbi:hypothetical protein [Magnetospirillum sp. UT-4]|uniref:hypothetical protein n=1 Tax=Magnetospirillum sp. UT-4 TaxID=2681467 RepID=UPI001381D479|nr:hypothetical protein [Magnetospirillum sp. UT-4]CAA7615229.1 conserved hypothetical protein [Magnetospirillum sp. UT-4]